MRTLLKPYVLSYSLILILLFSAPPIFVNAQEPLIQKILDAQISLVEVKAQKYGRPTPQSSNIKQNLLSQNLHRNQKEPIIEAERNGAGVIIHKNGFIVANLHTVFQANKVIVKLFDGRKVSAKIVQLLPPHDLALLKITTPKTLTPITFADSDQVDLGDTIVNVGNSPLLKETISGGTVIGLGSKNIGSSESIEMIKVNINLYKGDSGGPLLNQDGELIGMIMGKDRKKDRISYAIPSNKIKKLYLDFIN